MGRTKFDQLHSAAGQRRWLARGSHRFTRTRVYEKRRHWFNKPVLHDTQGALNVMNLVEGDEAVVESPQGAFEPFVVHYAETIIIPANVGAHIVRPLDAKNERQLATSKAFVRASRSDR